MCDLRFGVQVLAHLPSGEPTRRSRPHDPHLGIHLLLFHCGRVSGVTLKRRLYSWKCSINFVAAAEAPWGATGTPSIIVGMTPIAYVLVFGTQKVCVFVALLCVVLISCLKDVLLAWTFWRKSDNAPPSYPSVKMGMV